MEFEPYHGNHWAFRDLSEASPMVVWEGEGMNFSKRVNETDQLEADTERIKSKLDLLLHKAWTESISADDLRTFSSLILSPHGRKCWTQYMNARRASGTFKLTEVGFRSLAELFERVLDVCLEEADVVTTRCCIILSQTFYRGKGEDKEFVQSAIAQHAIWRKAGLWDSILSDAIDTEIDKQRLCGSCSESDLRNVVFAQLSAHAHLLSLFSVDKTEVTRALQRRCLQHHLDEEEASAVLGLTDARNEVGEREVKRARSLDLQPEEESVSSQEDSPCLPFAKSRDRRFSLLVPITPPSP